MRELLKHFGRKIIELWLSSETWQANYLTEHFKVETKEVHIKHAQNALSYMFTPKHLLQEIKYVESLPILFHCHSKP